MDWWKLIKGTVKLHEPLCRHTSFRIGGAADLFVEPRDRSDLALVLSLARKRKKKLFIAGAGSNLLVSDNGFKGIVVTLNAPAFTRIDFRGKCVRAHAGAALPGLSRACARRGLSGLEFLAGIPGTVGGAVAMNAGAWGKNIEDFIENITVMDYNGDIKLFKKKDIDFAYRRAGLQDVIILECVFKLKAGNPRSLREKMLEYRRRRLASQDLFFPSAGCVFRNPSKERPAGMMIDRCGLKGVRRGGAQISLKHANFIINRKNASSRDVRALMNLMRHRVLKHFGVDLEPEIVLVGVKKKDKH